MSKRCLITSGILLFLFLVYLVETDIYVIAKLFFSFYESTDRREKVPLFGIPLPFLSLW